VAELTTQSTTRADELAASRAETAAAKDDAEAYREDLEASNVSQCAAFDFAWLDVIGSWLGWRDQGCKSDIAAAKDHRTCHTPLSLTGCRLSW
jgi:hypothetical protein